MKPFLSRCRYSIGSSMVMMCSARSELMRSIIAASVVDLPEPVVPVVRIRPRCSSQICEEQRGLILTTGTTGSGKSTTLAAMIDRINSLRAEHIITIEDPIEYLHRDKKGFINQREVEVDTSSFSTALRAALRQDPDVVLVGEMRDLETISTALLAAETGHLVLS